jgi:hypothetical protein
MVSCVSLRLRWFDLFDDLFDPGGLLGNRSFHTDCCPPGTSFRLETRQA